VVLKEIKDHLDHLVLQEQMDQGAIKVILVLLVQLEQLVLKEIKDHLVLLEQELKEIQE
jgi:hypothetical protein